MHLICCYCDKYIKEKQPFDVERTTHGICPDCFVTLLKENEGPLSDEDLETIDVPILIADSESRIAAIHQTALHMVEKPIDRVVGLFSPIYSS